MPQESSPNPAALALLGQWVVVTLNADGPTVAEGRLLSFLDDGTVVLEDEVGSVNWCWPLLHITKGIEPHA